MWKLKVLIQFILAHMPFGEKGNHILQRLRSNRTRRARELEDNVPEICGSLKMIKEYINLDGAVIVEVGTGWCPLPTILLYLFGAAKIYTYDHIRHVRFSLIQEMLGVLRRKICYLAEAIGVAQDHVAKQLTILEDADSLEELFERANISYIAPGDATHTGLASSSVDLFFSYAVLEHVPETIISALLEEAKCVLKSSGCFYALIGLHDHYASFDKRISKVHFLKYPEWLWVLLVKNNISYHNRMREREYVDLVKRTGGVIKGIRSNISAEDVEKCRTMKLDTRFRTFTAEECAITRSEIIATFESTRM